MKDEMNTGVRRASHTRKVPRIGFPRNPPVTKVNNVEKAPIPRPVPEKRGKRGCFVNKNRKLLIATAI
jgi:hypothetical protein